MVERCQNCAQPLAAGALVCPHCHALVHTQELDRTAAAATALEGKKQWRLAREEWLKALPLLPRDAAQSTWIRDHARELLNSALNSETEVAPGKQSPEWAKKLGPLGPIAVLLVKSKTLLLAIFKLKFLLSFAGFIGVYWALWGMKFGIGFAILILIHELGHFIDIKRRGLPAEMPVFLPGLGAYVKWQALGVPLETRAEVSLAGPFAGWLASIACLIIWWKTGNPFWASLARVGAFLNVLNLIPVWILDGGQAALALGRTARFWLLTAGLALWLVLGEGIFALVAAGTAWRLFTKDMPEKSNRTSLAYYVGVLACLGIVLYIAPGHGFGGR
jgi:Zn-dependent protease